MLLGKFEKKGLLVKNIVHLSITDGALSTHLTLNLIRVCSINIPNIKILELHVNISIKRLKIDRISRNVIYNLS